MLYTSMVSPALFKRAFRKYRKILLGTARRESCCVVVVVVAGNMAAGEKA